MKLTFAALLGLVLPFGALAAAPAAVTVMTQNLNAGTGLDFAVAELMGALPPGVGVALTYDEIVQSNIPERADMLAAKIAALKPDLLVLQEVSLWRTGDSPDTATTVLYDQLQLLLAKLNARGVPYDIAAVNTISDLSLPMAPAGALRLTDRDAVLYRGDLRPPAFHLSDVHANLFDATYALGPLEIPAGWISATVHLGNRHFRLVMTHLQSPVGGDSSAAEAQAAQARQLIADTRNSTVPVVVAGDFNSDAILGSRGRGPDNTDIAPLFLTAGFLDAWTVAGSGDAATWPLYLQDQFPPAPFLARSVPYERIDWILTKGLSVVAAERVLTGAQWPYYASDHAGVIATLQF